MPKQVDHDERRREIAGAVRRIAQRDGLASVSFREVAAEAGMSVSLLQHYVGTKHQMLVQALDATSQAVGGRIAARLAALGDDAAPRDRLTAITGAFLPQDDDSRAAMQVYLQFGAAAMAEPALRSADAFANGRLLVDVLAAQLGEMAGRGELAPGIQPRLEALALVALLLGLSTTILLEQTSVSEARQVLRAHLDLLRND